MTNFSDINTKIQNISPSLTLLLFSSLTIFTGIDKTHIFFLFRKDSSFYVSRAGMQRRKSLSEKSGETNFLFSKMARHMEPTMEQCVCICFKEGT